MSAARPYSVAWWLAMVAISVASAALIVATEPAQAESWTGKDKGQHALVGAALGSLGTAASQSPTVGCLLGAGVGLAKEAYDAQHPDKHTASGKDFLVTAAAACLAAKVTGLLISPRGVSFTWEF